MNFYEQHRFGSAAWSSEDQLARAGLYGDSGPMLGYDDTRPLRLDGDAPAIVFGGAGSGKLRDLVAYNVCGCRTPSGEWSAPRRMLINDPRGELAAISIHNQVRFGKAAYCINPYQLHTLPRHRINPWDVIRKDSARFHADVKLVIADLIPLSKSSDGAYFSQRARDWSEALVKAYISSRSTGTTDVISMPAFYDLINEIEHPDAWADFAEVMLNSADGHVRRVAAEMDFKRSDAPKEYGAIIGSLYQNINFLSDPVIRECLSGGDFSLECLCKQDCNVYICIPAEYISLLAPMQRAIIGAAMLYKQRHPAAPRVLFLIDEAAQLGQFETLLRAYSYGRGMGIRAWSIWQDVGQISRNYGPDAVAGFMGSSQCRQFVGVRDLETAETVSRMLGMQTLEYDPELEQAAARRDKAHIVRELLAGADPFEAGINYAHSSKAAIYRMKQARHLMTADEILSLPETSQLLFISGLGLKPIYANKYPYFTRPEMAGAYLENPYHSQCGEVVIATGKGAERMRVITEKLPRVLSDWPQYQSGEWSYVEGYCPL